MSTDAVAAATDSIVLEEEIDPNYAPSDQEVVEYAKWLGMDLANDEDLFWIGKGRTSYSLHPSTMHPYAFHDPSFIVHNRSSS